MKLKSAFFAFVCLFFTLAPAKGHSNSANYAQQETEAVSFISNLLTIYQDGIVPAPVTAAETAPVSLRSPYPVVKLSSIPSVFSNLSLHQRFAYCSFQQPLLYHASPPLYLANRLLLI